VHAGGLLGEALTRVEVADRLERARAVDVIAVGKAAMAMLEGWRLRGREPRTLVGIGPQHQPSLGDDVEWFEAGHPLPNDGSVAGARRAIKVARGVNERELLVVLLSGGGSALMALPADGVTLEDKQATAYMLMAQGADITELNTVRKHLSAVKGGRLAVAADGRVLTLAVSDVVGDDLSVIASGPTVPDESTYASALAVLQRRGGMRAYPERVTAHLQRGVAGLIAETPKRGDAALAVSMALVIGPQRGAVNGARRAAEQLGYAVRVVESPVTGEARDAGTRHVSHVAAEMAGSAERPLCVISSGETTVTVRGSGRGGRNQELAFSMARSLGVLGAPAVAASVGTDGIDGPTDAAGAIADSTTFERARAVGIASPDAYLENNDTYPFFARLGDLIHTGPTATNVGDVQVVLVA
jgi:hydroxypyruvate reductase